MWGSPDGKRLIVYENGNLDEKENKVLTVNSMGHWQE